MPNIELKSKITSPKKSLLGVLLSTTQQKILSLFFLQEDREFTLKELISLAAAGSGAVQREIEKLTSTDLVSVKSVGRQKFYQVNKYSPIFEELKSILTKTAGVPELIRYALNKTIDEDIDFAFIFGSVAKKSDSGKSDVDLLVVASELPLSTLFDALEPVERQIGRKINPTLYTPEEWDQRLRQNNPFVKKVLASSKIYLVGEENEISGQR